MYEAKNSGKARYVIFDDRMHKDVVDRLNMERELREAVHSRAFSIAYEPIVDVKDNRIAGFEALVRWPHPTRGMILPGKFIGLAEELGLIGTIGHWVLVESCWQLKKWQQQYNFGRSMFVSVNLSRAQLRDPEIVSTMKRSIADTGIDPGCVQLEITESMIMDDLDETQTVLNELKALGVRLAMDDFGTGHSSLNCLHHLPLDVLKIDRSITNDVEKDMAQHQAIMKAIMDLAHNLKMNVIAEGVEKKSQLELLKQLTCDYGQGWLFTKPINAAAVEKILDKTEKRHTAAA
jgi:EAL domain-containing protein (putative c-di-GMP-specific phosphodiesterase class I)